MKLAVAVVILLVFVVLGLALAADFRGVAADWAERGVAARRLRLSLEAIRRQTVLATIVNRICGAVFALGSLAVLIAVIATA